MSSGGTRPGLQNPTPTSRARPVLYLRTAATFALAAPRRAGRTSRLAHQLRIFAMFAAMRRASFTDERIGHRALPISGK
jgi:hypothetical protein